MRGHGSVYRNGSAIQAAEADKPDIPPKEIVILSEAKNPAEGPLPGRAANIPLDSSLRSA
jgi:hypothetical protein